MNETFHRVCRFLVRWAGILLFGFRATGRRNLDTPDGFIFLCNHQSHFDPPMIGVLTLPPSTFMARDSLFRSPLFGRLITALGAFPVTRGRRDEGAFKAAQEAVEKRFPLLIFGEGTRSIDGEIQPLKGGVEIIARRASATIIPVVIDGAIECLPKGRSLLRTSCRPVVANVGEPVPASDYREWPKRSLPGRMREKLVELQTHARAVRAHGGPGITTLADPALMAVQMYLRGLLKTIATVVRLLKGKRKRPQSSDG